MLSSFRTKLSNVVPVVSGDSGRSPGKESSSRELSSGLSVGLSLSLGKKDFAKALSESGLFGRKASKSNEDEDKSDVATRNQHRVVTRSDGRTMIRAMNR